MTPPVHNCIVLDMRVKEGKFGKHEAHPPHDWWYTNQGGGHQMYDGFDPKVHLWERHYEAAGLKHWHCPGRQL